MEKRNGNNVDLVSDDNELFIYGENSFHEIVAMIKNHWGLDETDSIEDFIITAEHIHTHCVTYDLHDPSDWTTLIKVSYQPPAGSP